MSNPRFLVPVLALSTVGALAVAVAGPAPAVATGSITMDQPRWPRASIPSISFISSRRGLPQKVAAFLYVSEEPQAFTSSPYPPQFLGIFEVPFTGSFVVDRIPERSGPIDENSREKFLQGALFDFQTGALEVVTNEAYIDIVYDTPPTEFTLDFETEDDFSTVLVNGQDLSTPPEFGNLVSISSLQPPAGQQHLGPTIFDTTPGGPNAFSSDRDLLVGTGNAVILQENPGQSVPGIFDLPDDSVGGGSIVITFDGFDFIEKVEPRAIDLIDIDSIGGARVILTDVLGAVREFSVPTGWTGDILVDGPPGYRTLDLTTLAPQPGVVGNATATSDPFFLEGEVVRLEVVLTGSGAIDNLVFAREDDPAALVIEPPRMPGLRQGKRR